MKWVPVRSGEALLSLEIQPLKEEDQLHNNLSYLPVSIREKECAFFTLPGVRVGMCFTSRRLLKEMPEVDMIAFLSCVILLRTTRVFRNRNSH